MIEKTQGTPIATVPLMKIKPGDAFIFQGRLFLKLAQDAAIVELDDLSNIADFNDSNPMVTPVSKLEITWYT
jgi:hypothetical protein